MTEDASKKPDNSAELPWRPELTEAIYVLLCRDDLGLDRLVAELEGLAATEGPAVYAELLYLLAHIRFDETEAERHWRAVIQHRQEMEDRLEADVALSVALVSYFVQVNRQLHNPKLIELKVFEETRASAYRDELTDLHNFRFLQEYLTWELSRAERHGGKFSIAMGDIDNFKDYNDRHGHNQGNLTLQAVAKTLVTAGREEDVVARYGGEEFVIIMPATSKEHALGVADRARKAVADLELSDVDPTHYVTMSLGIASYPLDAESADDLIRCADRAMYLAKGRGKNQVQLYGANRRAHKRIHTVVSGEYRVFEEERRPFSTLDISERSLRVMVDRPVPANTLVEFTLALPESDQNVSANARVIRAVPRDEGTYEMALTIVDIESREYLALRKYLEAQAPESKGTMEPPD